MGAKRRQSISRRLREELASEKSKNKELESAIIDTMEALKATVSANDVMANVFKDAIWRLGDSGVVDPKLKKELWSLFLRSNS